MPEASVIIRTYNRPAHLARCLEAFPHQSASDCEILVADDGSGTETSEVVRKARGLPWCPNGLVRSATSSE